MVQNSHINFTTVYRSAYLVNLICNLYFIATTEGAKVVQSAEKDLNLEGRWNEASPQLSIVLENGSRVSDIVPFDPISEVPVEEQK